MTNPITTYTIYTGEVQIQTTSADRAEMYADDYKVTAETRAL